MARMQVDVMRAQAGTLDTWSREWRQQAAEGVEGASELGWQLGKMAQLVRKVAGIEIPAAVPEADEAAQALPAAAAGALREG